MQISILLVGPQESLSAFVCFLSALDASYRFLVRPWISSHLVIYINFYPYGPIKFFVENASNNINLAITQDLLEKQQKVNRTDKFKIKAVRLSTSCPQWIHVNQSPPVNVYTTTKIHVILQLDQLHNKSILCFQIMRVPTMIKYQNYPTISQERLSSQGKKTD